ncbi:glycosyltransferase family 2 protein [Pontiellaceae bacterium B12219]|nr:glycosyltransferase family 2 protein [Pontiellaceae bacterium B12219]
MNEKNDLPLVSVIVTFYNQAQYVLRALNSVLNQTYNNLEIIVVDDGSEDGTEQVVKKVDDLRIHFFRKENGGVSSARNFGFSKSKGIYVAFLDGDDAYLPNKIETLISKLKDIGFPQCAMVSGYYEVSVRGKLVSKYVHTPRITNPESDPISAFPNMRPSMVIYHRSILKELGGFPEELKINEDGAFNLRVYRKYPILCIPDILVLWQGDDAGKSRKVLQNYETAYETMESKVKYLEPWIGCEDALAYRRLHIRNNLCGFLSIGYPTVARMWFDLVRINQIPLDTFGSKIAACSVICRVNIYDGLRKLNRLRSSFYLRRRSRLLKDQLEGWYSVKF